MGNLGIPEMFVILVVALLVFGPDKVPELARQAGRGMREFRRVQDSLRGEVSNLLDLNGEATGAPVHPTTRTQATVSPRVLTGPAPSAMPSRYRLPGGGRVANPARASNGNGHATPSNDVSAPSPPTLPSALNPIPPRIYAPSRFRTPAQPGSS